MSKEKADYVRKQKQFRKHHCHWPNCPKSCPPAMWGCKEHWFRLPLSLRNKIWAAYRPGQEIDMPPSKEYIAVADEVEKWIRDNYMDRGDGSGAPNDWFFPDE